MAPAGGFLFVRCTTCRDPGDGMCRRLAGLRVEAIRNGRIVVPFNFKLSQVH